MGSGRRPWFNKFRATLGRCQTVDEIERLLRVKVQRWGGLAPLTVDEVGENEEDSVEDDDEHQREEQEEGVDAAMAALSVFS